MANSTAVTILDYQSSEKTVSTIDAIIGTGASPSANVLTVVPSSNFTVYPSPTASGGLSLHSITNSSSGTNATLVNAAACQVYGVELYNSANVIAFLRLYNSSIAPTPGSTTGLVGSFQFPTVGSTVGGVTATSFATHNIYGVPFSAGLGYTITGAIVSTDTTAVGLSLYRLNLYYK